MKYFLIGYLISSILILIACTYSLIKNENTFKKRIIIIDAIYEYRLWCFYNNVNSEVNYTDMEDYDKTDRRWKDWGYTNILPRKKFEIIKPFIKEEKK